MRLKVINLERRQDRKLAFEQRHKGQFLYDFVDAIDARSIKIPKWVFLQKDHFFSPGAYALARTTEMLLLKFLDNNEDFLVILEDDFILHESGYCVINNLETFIKNEVPSDFHLLYLSCMYHSGKNKEPVKGFPSVFKADSALTTVSYVINRQFAKQYLEFLKTCRMAIDAMLVEKIQPIGKCYVLSQQLGYQDSGKSDIANETVIWKSNGKEYWTEKRF